MKTAYQDVGAAGEQEDCNNGDGNGNALFLLLAIVFALVFGTFLFFSMVQS